MESLASLLAVSLGRDPFSPDFGADELDARIILHGLVRVVQDEDLVLELAIRLCEHRYGDWTTQDQGVRNECIENALEVMDAFRDLITEELST
jgi:hypothetical protein